MDQLLDFARVFRDGLGCSNALFLDGGEAPWLYAPELGRNDAPGHGGYGPIIAGEVGPDSVAQRSHRFGIPELLKLAGTTVRLRGLSETNRVAAVSIR